MQKLIVASNSPRRQQLIKELGFTFEVRTLDVDESVETDMVPTLVAEYLAVKKNKAYRTILNDEIILTADTVVIANGQILGKPKSSGEAIEMIHSFNNASHQVVSGVCISAPSKSIQFSETTEVNFSKLSSEEISFYVEQYQPFDKAGSYGIQEWIGMVGVQSIQGSFHNVMGLPVRQVYLALKNEFNLNPFER